MTSFMIQLKNIELPDIVKEKIQKQLEGIVVQELAISDPGIKLTPKPLEANGETRLPIMDREEWLGMQVYGDPKHGGATRGGDTGVTKSKMSLTLDLEVDPRNPESIKKSISDFAISQEFERILKRLKEEMTSTRRIGGGCDIIGEVDSDGKWKIIGKCGITF